jgi:hypothetical protein
LLLITFAGKNRFIRVGSHVWVLLGSWTKKNNNTLKESLFVNQVFICTEISVLLSQNTVKFFALDDPENFSNLY